MYKALTYFTDLQDNNYAYNVGDVYPHVGYTPTDARIDELSSHKNLRGVPVIAEYDDIRSNKAAETEKGTIAPEECINPPVEADNADTEEVKPKRTRKAKKNA